MPFVRGLPWLFPLATLIPSGSIFSAALENESQTAGALICALLIAALISPKTAVSMSLLVLPFVGADAAGTPSNRFFYEGLSALTLGLGLKWLIFLTRNRWNVGLNLANPVSLLLSLFTLIGILSLSSLPYDEVWARWQQLDSDKIVHLLSVKELWLVYPLVKSLALAQGFTLYLILTQAPTSWLPPPRRWLSLLMGGLLAALALGLLEFYGLINLSTLRPQFVEPGNALRLHGLPGHPAWFAMYVTMAIPSALVILTFFRSRKMGILALVGVLVLTEYTLILTMSRGSWITYLAALVVIWFMVYLGRPSDLPVAAIHRKDFWIKIAISLPITLIASLLLITVIGKESALTYIKRAKNITNISERSFYIKPALTLTEEHPVLGSGADSFSYRYAMGFVTPSSPHYERNGPLSKYYNNAHNTYLQILTGKGVIGLIAWLMVIITVIYSSLEGLRLAKNHPAETRQDIFLVKSYELVFILSVLIYGLFDDVFYPPNLAALLFVGLGLCETDRRLKLSDRTLQRAYLGLLLAFLSHLVWEYVYPGYTRKVLEATEHQGCYPADPTPEGGVSPDYWCSDHFSLLLPRIEFAEGAFAFQRLTPLPKSTPTEPVSIEVSGLSSGTQRTFMPGGRPSWLVIPLMVQDPNPVKVDLIADVSIVPALDPHTKSLDRRRLSVNVLTGENDPLAFSGREAVCERISDLGDGWQGQWCSQGGRMDISWLLDSTSVVGFKSADPTTSPLNPLWVWLTADGSLPHMVEIRDPNWHSFESLGLGRCPKGLAMFANRSWLLDDQHPIGAEFAIGRSMQTLKK